MKFDEIHNTEHETSIYSDKGKAGQMKTVSGVNTQVIELVKFNLRGT